MDRDHATAAGRRSRSTWFAKTRSGKGLLFAGTERTVYVSFDDGDHWQSLALNMPATSIRDLIIKDDDLVVATHGRGFWILDDIAPLRQMNAARSRTNRDSSRRRPAMRVRWSRIPDTPLPPDEPAGDNPPDGAIIDYQIASGTNGPVILEILDQAGKLVRRFSSDDTVQTMLPNTNVPSYWVRPPMTLMTSPGVHRFVWDLHYPYPKNISLEYPISAIPHNTIPGPLGPWVLPGTYTVRLTIAGTTLTKPLRVTMDPRVVTAPAGLSQQFTLSMALSAAMAEHPKDAENELLPAAVRHVAGNGCSAIRSGRCRGAREAG